MGPSLCVSTDDQTNPKLEVKVLFTTERCVLAALKAAGKLASGLNAPINVTDAQAVPRALPISRPPLAIVFSLRRLHELARQGAEDGLETSVNP
jgi:hypothetical protein